MPDCIVNYWPQWFRSLYGGTWPTTYCTIDCETTGFAMDRDVVTEFGHCLVEDGKILHRGSVVIDWTGHPIVRQDWLEARLLSLEQSMRHNGASSHMSIERMKSGVKPDKALAFVRDFTDTIKKRGILFVAHNGLFDEAMISANLRGFSIAKGFSFGDNGWIDTDGVEKASQALHNERVHPKKGDTLRQYWHRVRYTRLNGIKSNLGIHCHNKYDFAGKGFPKSEMHGAETDAVCTHLLVEEYRKLLTDGPPKEVVYPTAMTKDERKEQPVIPMPKVAAGVATIRRRGQRNS